MTNLYEEMVRLLKAHQQQIENHLQSDETKYYIDMIEEIAQRGTLTDNEYDTASLAYDRAIEVLFSSPFDTDGDLTDVPDWFWTDGIGKALMTVQCLLHDDELITISEASMILRGDTTEKDLMSVRGYIKRGKLREFIDNDEPNPQRNKRVLRSEVEALKT